MLSLLRSRIIQNAPKRFTAVRAFSSHPVAIERLEDDKLFPAEWIDFRENLVEVNATRDANGDLVGQWEGETVIFPDQDVSLDFVLTTPVDVHLFEETPIIKECPEYTEELSKYWVINQSIT